MSLSKVAPLKYKLTSFAHRKIGDYFQILHIYFQSPQEQEEGELVPARNPPYVRRAAPRLRKYVRTTSAADPSMLDSGEKKARDDGASDGYVRTYAR